MKKDLFITFSTEAIVLICGLLTYKLANMNMGGNGFAVYALCRRTHSFIFPALALGSTVAIPRFIAFSKVEDEGNADSFFIAGLSLVSITTAIFVVFTLLLPSQFAVLFFNDKALASLARPLALMMAGYACHCLCYAYYRGHSNMAIANILQIINIAVIPVAATALFRTPQMALFATGFCWLTIAGIVLALKISLRLRSGFSLVAFKQLTVFGVQRVPADFGAAALLGLPATLTAHYSGAISAGHVSFGISLLNMCGAAFAPIGLVLLPKASAAVARRDWVVLKKYLKSFLMLSFILSSVMTFVFELFARQILTLYLGQNLEEGIIIAAKTVMFGAIPYCVYVALRSIIDAFFEKSVNAMNILIALGVFIVLTSAAKLYELQFISPMVSLVTALFLLGAATVATCFIIQRKNREQLT